MTDFKFPRPVFEDESGCWFVLSRGKVPKKKGSRPQINLNGERWSGHRLSYSLNVERIPRKPPLSTEGLVLHTCDDGHCINPDHLYLGSASDNMRDRSKRNRNSWQAVSRSRAGKPLSEETRKRISQANKGKKRGDEFRQVMSSLMKEKWNADRGTEETRLKMSALARKRWEAEKNNV